MIMCCDCCQCGCCKCRCGLCCGCQCQCPTYKRQLCCLLCRCFGCFFKCFCCLPRAEEQVNGDEENEYLLPNDNNTTTTHDAAHDIVDNMVPSTHAATTPAQHTQTLKPVLDLLPNRSLPSLPAAISSLGGIKQQLHDKKWYHKSISKEVAHARLFEGITYTGSYLVYDHPVEEGHYILLIYYNGKAIELKIYKRRNDDMYLLETERDSLGYKTVRDLIKSHRQDVAASLQKRPIQLVSGETIFLHKKYISRPKDMLANAGNVQEDELQCKSWYHGAISVETAETRLREAAQQNGAYLVYDHPNEMGNYVLLVYFEGEVLRWKISRVISSDGIGHEYVLGDRVEAKYRTVKELVKEHRGLTGRPIRLDNGKLVTLSKSYIMRSPEN